MEAVRAVIAGGGTGGHLFPGIAIAKELRDRFREAEILFVVGRRRMESEILARCGFPAASIDVEGLKGRQWRKALAVAFKLPKSFVQSVFIIKRFAPQLVVGVGGYSSGPFCMAARAMGVPTAIHEQNSFPGLTNRLLCRFVEKVFISFEESRERFSSGSFLLTGNPVREELLSSGRKTGQEGAPFTVLVMGGSQGARAINEAFAEALETLKADGRRLRAIHQTGEADFERTSADYRKRGVEGEAAPFIQDMASAYSRADMVVSRAGATTISELAALGKPAVLIPYPYAANQHQEANARSLVGAGAAEMILQRDLTGKGLAEVLEKFMDNRALLEAMGKKALSAGRPDAAKAIVDELTRMIDRRETAGK